MGNFVPVNPKIIEWARAQQGDLTQAALAQLIGVHENQIIKWESRDGQPTFAQARQLAEKLHIPFGYLFLTDPPQLEMPLPDLRTRRDKPLKNLSSPFREHLYSVLDKHDWYREYILEYNAEKLPFVGRFNVSSDPLVVAEDIRATLSISQGLRQMAQTWSAYLDLLSMKAEAVGILVMRSSFVGANTRRGLSADEFQGFVLTDEFAPLVFINNADYVTARIFTLIHEVAHIWIGKSGVVNPDESLISDTTNTERFCNVVATESLVPKDEFLITWNALRGSIISLAEHFRVSEIVIARRAQELSQITQDRFFVLLEEIKGRQKQIARGGRRDPIVNVANRNSPLFMDALIKDVRVGGTLLRDGARLLNMKLPTFTKVVQAGEF